MQPQWKKKEGWDGGQGAASDREVKMAARSGLGRGSGSRDRRKGGGRRLFREGSAAGGEKKRHDLACKKRKPPPKAKEGHLLFAEAKRDRGSTF